MKNGGAWILIALFIGFAIWSGMKILPHRFNLQKEYQELLDQLENDPTNRELKKKILEVGREFWGMSPADELKIKNDIDTRCN